MVEDHSYFDVIGLFEEVEWEADVRRKQAISLKACQVRCIEKQYQVEHDLIKKEARDCLVNFKRNLLNLNRTAQLKSRQQQPLGTSHNDRPARACLPVLTSPSTTAMTVSRRREAQNLQDLLKRQNMEAELDLSAIYGLVVERPEKEEDACVVTNLEYAMLDKVKKDQNQDQHQVKEWSNLKEEGEPLPAVPAALFRLESTPTGQGPNEETNDDNENENDSLSANQQHPSSYRHIFFFSLLNFSSLALFRIFQGVCECEKRNGPDKRSLVPAWRPDAH
jgi:hypothetical protein